MSIFGDVEIFDDAATKITDNAECRSYLERLAATGAENARSNAPVLTGAYRDSIGSELFQEAGEPEARITAGTDYWRWLEYGTIHNEPFRTLTNALASISGGVMAP